MLYQLVMCSPLSLVGNAFQLDSDSCGAYTGAALIDESRNEVLKLQHSAASLRTSIGEVDVIDMSLASDIDVKGKLCKESTDKARSLSAWSQFVTDFEKHLSTFVTAHKTCLQRVRVIVFTFTLFL